MTSTSLSARRGGYRAQVIVCANVQLSGCSVADTELKTDQLHYIRAEIRAEVDLLNARLNSLMSSQAFLVIAYASTLSSGYGDFRSLFILLVPPFLAVLGAALVLEAKPSLKAALEALDDWRKREASLVASSEGYAPFTLAVDEQTRHNVERRQYLGRHFAVRAPAIMLTAWIVFLLLPGVLYLWG